jgi:hypothetical protein
MHSTDENIQYVLPPHRIKILGSIVFGLILFLIYALSNINKQPTLLDFLLIPALIGIGFWFRRFLRLYSKIGFNINQLGIFNLDETLICSFENIDEVDVSPYTFKSANGFIIHLKTGSAFKFVPGLFWQLGRRISIGGMISKSESKYLSNTLLSFIEQKSNKKNE